MPYIPRQDIVDGLRRKIDCREPIIGAGAGTGLSAKCFQAAGLDLIIVYNSGRYRMAGRGSLAGLLAFGNANETVIDLSREILPVVPQTPVIAGVNGTDPFYDPHTGLEDLRRRGFSGIQNFPTVGLIDGTFRANLEETGLGFDCEVNLIKVAHDLNLLTTPYVFSTTDTIAMVQAGADIIICHMGLTTGGTIGAATAKTRDDCVQLATEWAKTAHELREDIIVLVHGGPIAEPDDAAYVLHNAEGLHGFYGASSMERLPTERALAAQAASFRKITL